MTDQLFTRCIQINPQNGRGSLRIPVARLCVDDSGQAMFPVDWVYDFERAELNLLGAVGRFSLSTGPAPGNCLVRLPLSDGRVIETKLEPGVKRITGAGFFVDFTDGFNTATVCHKNGVIEVFKSGNAQTFYDLSVVMPYVLTRYITAAGNCLSFDWVHSESEDIQWESPPLTKASIYKLSAINDSRGCVLSASWNRLGEASQGACKLVLFPGRDEQVTYQCQLQLPGVSQVLALEATGAGVVGKVGYRMTGMIHGRLELETKHLITLPAESEEENETTETSIRKESVIYTSDKISTYTLSLGEGMDAITEHYTYEESQTTVKVCQGVETDKDGKVDARVVCRRVYQYKDNVQVSESCETHGVTYTTEQSVTTDKARAVAVVKNTRKVAGAVVDEVIQEYSADGNLLCLTQGDQVTEFTYYNNYMGYSVKEEASRFEDTSFFGFLLKPLDYLTLVGAANAIFGSSGLTWGTRITTTVDMALANNDYAQKAFNLPVAVNYPGDAQHFANHIESMLVSRKDGNHKHPISLTYYGYTAFTPRAVEGFSCSQVAFPALKLTVLHPTFTEVDVTDEQLKVAKAAAGPLLDSLYKERDRASAADQKMAFQTSITDLRKSLEAQSKANARGFKLNTPWQDGCMQLEELTYHSDQNKPGFGLVKSTKTVLLDGKGKEISASETLTSVDYSVDAKDPRKLTISTTVKTADALTVTSSLTRSSLTGRVYERVDGEGRKTVNTYSADLSGTSKITRNDTVEEESTYRFTPLKGKLFQYQSHSSRSGEHKRTIQDELGREIERLVSHDGVRWLKLEACRYDSSGRAQTTSEFDYDSAGKPVSTRETCWTYDDKANRCTATIVLKDANDKEIDRNVQIVEKTATGNTLTMGTFKVQQHHDFANNTLTETFGQANEAHYKMQQMFTSAGALQAVKHLSVGKDKKETEVDSVVASYDALGQLKTLTPKSGGASAYTYDPFGRLLTASTNGVVLGNQYSNANLSRVALKGYVKDADGESELGHQTVDGLGRVTSQTLSGVNSRFTYAGSSSLAKHGNTGEGPATLKGYERTLESHGMEHSESITRGKVVHKTRTRFSHRHNVLEFEGLLGGKTRYNYDALGRLVKSANSSCEATFAYADNGLLREETIKAVKPGITMTVTYGYDVMGQETRREFSCPGFDPIVIERTLLGDGRLAKSTLKVKDQERRSDSYEYDDSFRLKVWSCQGDGASNHVGKKYVREEFTYDALGDVLTRKNESYTGTTRPEKLTSDTSVYGYDPTKPGAMTSSGTSTMVEDEAGRLIKRVNRSITYYGNGQVKTYSATMDGKGADYVFDYDDLRRIRGGTAGTWNEAYHYRGQKIYAVVQTDSSSEFGFSARTLVLQNDSPGCWMQDALTTRDSSSAESRSFELRDAAGTVFASLDLEKKTITYYVYSPFGYRNPDRASVTWRGFKGEPLNMLSLYHLGNGYRLYDPQLHRFQTPDSKSPFGSGGISVYAYCNSDPVNYHDPSGHQQVAQYGRLDSAPWMYSTGFRAAMGALNVLAAPFTAGASLALALATTGLALVSFAFDIASIVLEESDPQLARTLEYIGIGVGLAAIAAVGLAALRSAPKLPGGAGVKAGCMIDEVVPKVNPQLRNAMATRRIGEEFGTPFYLYSNGPNSERLVIVSHGVPVNVKAAPNIPNYFSSSLANKVGYYADEGFVSHMLGRSYEDAMSGAYLPKNYYSGSEKLPNYLLSEFTTENMLNEGGEHFSKIPNFTANTYLAGLAQINNIDFISPLTPMTLQEVMTIMELKGFRYTSVDGMFCRGTRLDVTTSKFEQRVFKKLYNARDWFNGARLLS